MDHSTITQITIKNIKKFGEDDNSTIRVALSSGKINLCVAPNGFGKSSIAAAFSCLRPHHLEVNEELVNKNQTSNKCSIEVEMDGERYHSDRVINNIGKVLNVFVIRGRTIANYKKIPTKFKKTYVKSYLDVKAIDICKIQKKPQSKYSVRDMRKLFGQNGAILKSIDPLIEYLGRGYSLKKVVSIIKKFLCKKRYQLINTLKEKINEYKCPIKDIISEIDYSQFRDLELDEVYIDFCKIVKVFYEGKPSLDIFCDFFQLIELYKHDSNSLKEMISYSQYQSLRKNLDECLKDLNTSQEKTQTRVKEGRLVIEFPSADLLSNGQRDVLTFVVELVIFESLINRNKKNLLIIDEVFDYLDDANIMAAQYFLSEILKKYKGEIFIMLLTHLNPNNFRNYVFSDKIINHVYLKKSRPVVSEDMIAFISFRESLKREKAAENDRRGLTPAEDVYGLQLYDEISANLFHYHPKPKDLTKELAKREKSKLKTSWGNAVELKHFLMGEVEKYFRDEQNYDPFAVAMAMRFRIEKLAYEQLEVNLQAEFIEIHTTKKKLEFCVEKGIEIPSVYFLVNSIHNEVNHIKIDDTKNGYVEHAVVFKLENVVIKNILKRIFSFNNGTLNVNAL